MDPDGIHNSARSALLRIPGQTYTLERVLEKCPVNFHRYRKYLMCVFFPGHRTVCLRSDLAHSQRFSHFHVHVDQA